MMTGTSLDGLDASLVELRGRGLTIAARLVAGASRRFPPSLAADLRSAAAGEARSAAWFASLARRFGALHAEIAAALARRSGRVDLVVAHGQTVAHAPPDSWQLLNPFPIAARLGTAVAWDLRQADLSAGGEGAPITPLSDWILFRDRSRQAEARVILNLGGFANATLLPAGGGPDEVRGFDCCACNQLLDALARRRLRRPFDRDGRAASRGKVEVRTLGALRRRLAGQGRKAAERGRSLGHLDSPESWLDAIDALDSLRPADALATAVEAVADAIASAIRRGVGGSTRPATILVAGGGARHQGLVAAIARHAGCPVEPLDRLGIPGGAREAVAMAVLGAVALDGVDLTLPQVTGRRHGRTGGGILPAAILPPSVAARPGTRPLAHSSSRRP